MKNKIKIENHVIMLTRALPRRFFHPFDISDVSVFNRESSGPKQEIENNTKKIVHTMIKTSPISKEIGTLYPIPPKNKSSPSIGYW